MSDYALKYKISFDTNQDKGFSKQEALELTKEDPDSGAADALFFVSVLKPKSGEFSIATLSMDGQNKGKPLSEIDLFKIWSLIACGLSKKAAHEWQRFIAEEAFNKVRQVIAGRNKYTENDA